MAESYVATRVNGPRSPLFSTAAIARPVELARPFEQGYKRYWAAEHHAISGTGLRRDSQNLADLISHRQYNCVPVVFHVIFHEVTAPELQPVPHFLGVGAACRAVQLKLGHDPVPPRFRE